MEDKLSLRYTAKSARGVRQTNQDSAFASENLLMVADGMGGHAGGDIASYIAVHSFEHLNANPPTLEEGVEALQTALRFSYLKIVETVKRYPHLKGMGTTITVLLKTDQKMMLMHLGDSRAYLLQNEALTQITSDHSLVQRLVESGEITPEEAKVHPKRNMVVKVLGDFDFDVDMTPDISIRDLVLGDRYLLCSDGISGILSNDEIEGILLRYKDPSKCAERLINAALKAGSADNATCVIADVVSENVDEAKIDGTQSLPNVRTLKLRKSAQKRKRIVGAAADDAFEVLGNIDIKDIEAMEKATLKELEAEKADEEKADEEIAAIDREETSEDAVEEEIRARKKRTKLIVAVSIIIAFIIALTVIGFAALNWTKTQYYVGVDKGNVAIYQGVPTKFASYDLSEVYATSCLPISEVTDADRQKIENGVVTESLTEARSKIYAFASSAGLLSVSNPRSTYYSECIINILEGKND
ncbi:MAG: protein phosphatase 2C domain-containing protein [Bifidobacteriaceae bacterium]|jgi:protein phosphatase|nr:protein phosphatase 2C domain-containing protein [Bifidobacteriaceae bacterium]